MGINRIVLKNLQGQGLIKKKNNKYFDLRPRDEFGILQGYCSKMAKERREKGKVV